MKKQNNRLFIVGLFISIGLLLLIVGIYFVGQQQNLFEPTVNVHAVFDDVQGLKVGDNVRYSGIDIGTVSHIRLVPQSRVLTTLTLKEDVSWFIKDDSRASIGNEGLMGSKIVVILPGAMEREPISDDDTLTTIEQVDIDEIMRDVKRSSENISLVSRNLIDITGSIKRGEGIFGTLFSDTTLTNDLNTTGRNAAIISQNLIDVTEKINSGYGILGKLFADTTLTRELDSASHNLNVISENIAQITKKIERGEGIFGRLFTDTTITNNLYNTSKNMALSTSNLVAVTGKLNNENNALSKIIDDPSFADSLDVFMQRLNEGILEVTKASEAIQNSGFIRFMSKDEPKDKE
jgi:phospholipid/cholesterol/gamma-HCH transport system substrate-binding protein